MSAATSTAAGPVARQLGRGNALRAKTKSASVRAPVRARAARALAAAYLAVRDVLAADELMLLWHGWMTALRGLAGERPRTAAAPVRVPRTSILPLPDLVFRPSLLQTARNYTSHQPLQVKRR